MAPLQFNRDETARRRVAELLALDPDVEAIYYLPHNSPERDIRLIVVNSAIVERAGDPQQPLAFSETDESAGASHRVVVIDVTPAQWERMLAGEIALPAGWSLKNSLQFPQFRHAA